MGSLCKSKGKQEHMAARGSCQSIPVNFRQNRVSSKKILSGKPSPLELTALKKISPRRTVKCYL